MDKHLLPDSTCVAIASVQPGFHTNLSNGNRSVKGLWEQLMATRAECQQALAAYENDLARRRNVVGLGVVSCSPAMRAGCPDELAVAVYVSRKVPADQLNQEDVLPCILRVRHRGQEVEVPVRVIEQGVISFDSAHH